MSFWTGLVLGLWPMMMIAGWLAFWRDGLSAQWRNRLWPVWTAGGGILFCVLLWQTDGGTITHLALTAALAVYIVSTVRRVRFCPNCASLQTAPGFFERPRMCTACGKLMDAPAGDAAPTPPAN